MQKPLATGLPGNLRIDLLKLEPGRKYPEHTHAADEWVFVAEGSMSDHRGTYEKGDLLTNLKGSSHSVQAGPQGCELLVVWTGKLLGD